METQMENLIITDTKQIWDALQMMQARGSVHPSNIFGLQAEMRTAATAVDSAHGSAAIMPAVAIPLFWRNRFLDIGHIVLEMVRVDAHFESEAFCDLLLHKHKCYGAKPLLRWGEIGVIVRLSSKVDRVENMMPKLNGPTECKVATTESIFDTLQDILGYCVLGYLLTFVPAERKGVNAF